MLRVFKKNILVIVKCSKEIEHRLRGWRKVSEDAWPVGAKELDSSSGHIRDSTDNQSNVSSVISKHNPPVPLPIDMLSNNRNAARNSRAYEQSSCASESPQIPIIRKDESSNI
ncbi:unnamed protein product [Heterobilharzia americana]|nr:unnamed protein product [Heterobilharzia americana]